MEWSGDPIDGRFNPLLEFFRTMFVQDPGDGGGALQRQMRRNNAAPDANDENHAHEE